MKHLPILFFAVFSISLTACHDSQVHVIAHADTHYDNPQIRDFSVVDSFGDDSNHPPRGGLVLDPYVDDGLFELYWDVGSFADYTVNLYINDAPDLRGAIRIGTDYCGPGQACDDYGMQICEYSLDFYVGCGIDLYDAHNHAKSIDALLWQVPEKLYLSIEVCPVTGGVCEFDSVPVTLY